MGTRADFYVRKDSQMEYLGSIAWDGYPSGIDEAVLRSTDEKEYRDAVDGFFTKEEDSSRPQTHGWPWPWDDSRTTDYSYIFETDQVKASHYGYPLFDPLQALLEGEEGQNESEDDEKKMEGYFPDMSAIKNVRMDGGSGLIIVSAKR